MASSWCITARMDWFHQNRDRRSRTKAINERGPEKISGPSLSYLCGVAEAETSLPSKRDFSWSGSAAGGKQVFPEQTKEAALAVGRCDSVSRKATGSDAGATPG